MTAAFGALDHENTCQVETMSVELEAKKITVATAQKDCEELLVEIVSERRVADEQKKQASHSKFYFYGQPLGSLVTRISESRPKPRRSRVDALRLFTLSLLFGPPVYAVFCPLRYSVAFHDKTLKVEQESERISKDATECQIIADDAQADLAVAMPALEAAMAEVDKLDKNSITEVRSILNPILLCYSKSSRL